MSNGFYTDFWASDRTVLASKWHRAVGKETRKTSYSDAKLFPAGQLVQQHLKTTGVSPSAKDLIVF